MQHQSGPFNFENPTIRLGDICHNLAHTNRFNGSTDVPWSVAEHCILCYWLAKDSNVEPIFLLPILLHDAHEYVLGDPNGLIVQHYGDWYHKQRDRFDYLISTKFGFSATLFKHTPVKYIDQMALFVESQFLFANRADILWNNLDQAYGTNEVAAKWLTSMKAWRKEIQNRTPANEIALKFKDLILQEVGQ